MEWKTNWGPQDNYDIGNFERLLNNLIELQQTINSDYGEPMDLTVIELDGYATIPFADMLNTIEENLKKLQNYGNSTVGEFTWYPALHAPDHMDINRWETSGQLVESALARGKLYKIPCGVGGCGQPSVWHQRFRRY